MAAKKDCRNCGQPYVKHQAFMENCPWPNKERTHKTAFRPDQFYQPVRREARPPAKEPLGKQSEGGDHG
jgi:hypothetical protein